MTALNIRPFTDALRGTGHPWRKLGDHRCGGERIVTFGCLFRGNTEVDAPAAWAGDRWLTIQLWGSGNHRVSHMFVTCDCPRDEDGSPRRLRGITRPSDFKTPAEMLIAIQVELLRGDHTPSPGIDHAPLDQRTSMLVDRFAFALKEKLLDSQSKYGWTDHWAKDDWQDRCTQALCDHLAKGDPRDVAAFAAFLWHHGWPTADMRGDGAQLYVPGVFRCAKCDFQLIQSNLNARDGTVTARDAPGDRCPNDGSPMWRVSWKDYANQQIEGFERLLDEKNAQIAALNSEATTTAEGLPLGVELAIAFVGGYCADEPEEFQLHWGKIKAHLNASEAGDDA